MSYEQILTRYHWLQLSNEQRILMRQIFNIPKSGGVEMMGNKMLSDGSNENDLKAINIKSMQDFLECTSTDDTFMDLYDRTIEKVNKIISDAKETELRNNINQDAQQRTIEINQIVNSIIETITNLPLDAKMRIKHAISSHDEVDQEEITPETPNVTIKKAGRPKKVKETENI